MNDDRLSDEEDMEFSREYRPSDAYLQQELDLKKALLAEEFRHADFNLDGYISQEELLRYLDKQVLFLVTE